MKSEKIITRTNACSVNIAGNKVDSYRSKKDMTTVVRVYDGGNIGIAATVGEDDGTLAEKAAAKLAQGIAYPDDLPENRHRSEGTLLEVIPQEAFVSTIKKLVARLVETYPDFIFSYKIEMKTLEVDYSNSCNTEYAYKGGNMDIVLQIKEKKSANIMDLFYGASVKSYDEDGIVKDIGRLLSVFTTKVDFPAEDVPVYIGEDILYNLLGEITAEKYMAGASLFNGKLGEKIFSDKLTIFSDKSPDDKNVIHPFFDAEGTVCDGDKFVYVDKGVLRAVATYRRTAKQFSLPLTGAAHADFDGVPQVGFMGVEVETDGVRLSDVVKGKSIYIALASGGDMSSEGNYATPVMLAYLCEDGIPMGVLPPFGISANVFDCLGKDLIAVAENDMFTCCKENVIVTRFNINK